MRGYLRQRGKNRAWHFTYDLPPAPGDKDRRQETAAIGVMTRAQAEKKARDILRSVDDGSRRDERPMTVEQLLRQWLSDREHRIERKTSEGYQSKVNVHLTPLLGKFELSELSPQRIVEAYKTMREKGLSGQSCLHVHRILHAALNYGVKTMRVLKENPADFVDAPKANGREVPPISVEQVRRIIEAAKSTRLELPIMLAALTGLRRGELLALKWASLEFERKRLFVTEALEQTREHGVRFKSTKSRSSRRAIPLPDAMIDALKAHKSAQDAERQDLGDCYQDSDLVFCNPGGSVWPPDTLSNQFAKIAMLAGLKGSFRLHDLRHAFASLVLKDGTSVKEVAVLLGHSSAMLTLTTYARSVEGMGREAVNGLARSILESEQGSPAP